MGLPRRDTRKQIQDRFLLPHAGEGTNELQFEDARTIEAFSAAEKLNEILDDPTHPVWCTFSPVTHAELAVHTGQRARTVAILQNAFSDINKIDKHDYNYALTTPAIFPLFLDGTVSVPFPVPWLQETSNALIGAFKQRMSAGRVQPLPNIGWPELLERFSQAAFTAYQREYKENEVDCPDDIVMLPATEEDIAIVENRLGLALPEDYKEFLMCANGSVSTRLNTNQR